MSKTNPDLTLKRSLVSGRQKHFTVRNDELADKFVPFNHAGCQCGFPEIDVHGYFNLRDYPYLSHIHLIAQEFDGQMYVWSVYAGVVAL